MNILIIPSWFPSEQNQQRGIFFKEQAEGLSKLGYNITILDVQIISLNTKRIIFPRIETFKENGLTYLKMNVSKWIPKSRRYQRAIYYKAIAKLMDQINFDEIDVIHCHSFFNAGYSAIKYAECNDVNTPILLTEHSSLFIRNLLSEEEKKILTTQLDKFNRIFSVSEYLKSFLKVYTNKNIEILPNIVDTNIFLNYGIRSNEENNILSVGFLNENKGMDILIESFKLLREEISDAKLKIVGDGPEQDKLESMIKKNNLENSVSLLGRKDRLGVIHEMNRSNIFVTTSKNETFSVVIIEALSTGLPVLATKSGGPNFLIEDYNGILAENEDIYDISRKMIYLLKNKKEYDADIIRQKTIKQYSMENVLSRLSKIYEESKYEIQ